MNIISRFLMQLSQKQVKAENNIESYNLQLDDMIPLRSGYADAILTAVDESYSKLDIALDESLNKPAGSNQYIEEDDIKQRIVPSVKEEDRSRFY